MESADGPVTFDMNGWPEELGKATWRFDAETGSIKMLMAQATLSMWTWTTSPSPSMMQYPQIRSGQGSFAVELCSASRPSRVTDSRQTEPGEARCGTSAERDSFECSVASRP